MPRGLSGLVSVKACLQTRVSQNKRRSHTWPSAHAERSAIPRTLMSRRRAPLVGVTNWVPSDDNQYMERLTSALREAGVRVGPTRLAPVAVLRAFARGLRVV